jgi:hypothetical protein
MYAGKRKANNMSNSIVIATFDIDLIEDTDYDTWIDFWLNEESYSPELNRRAVRNSKGDLVEVELPFSGAHLEMLVMEEFAMILEHLGCGTFEEFGSLIKYSPGTEHAEAVNLVVRGLDGSVYLRKYLFNAVALEKLARLCAKKLTYRVWSQKAKD